jgi:lipopolysaccharide transport system permease protein
MSAHRIVVEAGKENKTYWKDVWNFRGLFYFLAWRDVLVRYKQTSIGILWAIIRPGLTIAILSFVRYMLGNDEKSDIPIPLMIAAGTLPWTFFSSAFSEASGSLISNSNLVSKVYFPRLIVPASSVIVTLIDFLISFAILLGIMLFYPQYFGPQLLMLPVFLFLAVLTAMGTGIYFAAVTVKYRDLRYVIPFIVQFGMYISPVLFTSQQFYSWEQVPDWAKFVYSMNPMVAVIDGFRWCIFGQEMEIHWTGFLISIGISLLFLVLGIFTFRKMEKEFADVI